MKSSAALHTGSPKVEDEGLRELASMASDMIRALAQRWRFRIEAGRLGRHSLSDSAAFVRRLEDAAQLIDAEELRVSRAGTKADDTDERFRLLVDQVTDYAIFLLDEHGHVASWNAGAERIKGYRAEEVLGKHFSMFYPPEERGSDKPRRELETAARDGRYIEEGIRVRKNGERFWASVVLTALRDCDGKLRGFAKVTRDVTEMRAALEALRQSEERMRVMIEVVRDYAIFMLDPQGNVVSWNAGAERLKGYKAEEIIGRNFSAFYTAYDKNRQHPQNELRIAIRDGRYEEEGWRVRKDGTQFWANVVITTVYDHQGRHVGFTKVTRDYTERRLADQRLRESEERFRLMIESVRDYAIFMLDPTGRVSTWNTGAQNIKGYTADEIIGKHFSIFYRPEDAAKGMPERELRIARETGRYEEEGWRVRKNGERLWVNVVLTAIHDERGELRGFAKVTRDLTERKKLEEEARAADRKALEAQLEVKVRDEFMSIAAHELRTPLTALQLKLQGVRDVLSKGSLPTPRLMDRFDSAGRQVKRLAELVERLLDVSRIAGGRLNLNKAPMDLARTVREVADDFREPAHQAGIALTVNASDEVQGVWDRARIEQVIVNLLANALKYGNGRPVEVCVDRRDGLARVLVKDHGIGVSREDAERIFGRFERAVPISNYGGLGLGLYITRHIVDAHGGIIRVESEPGAGATFIVELPT